MVALVFRSVAIGLLWAILVPVLLFALTLGSGYLFDSRCGTPGDSGGCEMGAAAFAIASVVPGFVIGFAVVFIRGLRRVKGTPPA